MKNIIMVVLLGVAWVVMACSCDTAVQKRHKTSIVPTPPVNIDDASKGVITSINHNQRASTSVKLAQAEIRHAKARADDTDKLIHTMKQVNSSKLEKVVELKQEFDGHIVEAETQLVGTGNVLTAQLLQLRKTEIELVKAKEQSIASENEKEALRVEKEALESTVQAIDEELKKAEGYKDKYHKLTKYKWIVWGLGAWILIKFLGGLGAWSPQGRIARAFFG